MKDEVGIDRAVENEITRQIAEELEDETFPEHKPQITSDDLLFGLNRMRKLHQQRYNPNNDLFGDFHDAIYGKPVPEMEAAVAELKRGDPAESVVRGLACTMFLAGRELGKATAGRRGGHARAQKLSARKRSKSARNAARVRWAKS